MHTYMHTYMHAVAGATGGDELRGSQARTPSATCPGLGAIDRGPRTMADRALLLLLLVVVVVVLLVLVLEVVVIIRYTRRHRSRAG